MRPGNYTLGIDLGPSSMGWAVVSEPDQKILGTGVRIFPEGVDRDTTGAEHPKNEKRRIVRGHRRQIARRARRKNLVRRALKEIGWWPLEEADLLCSDPYELRAKGLDQVLTLKEFGRVLLQFAQRRGFLSNRKADRGKQKENSETLAKISALQESIKDSGCRTLGEYFHRHRPVVGDPAAERIRARHTHRLMYEEEFELLWEKQREFAPEVFTEALKYGRQGKQTYPRRPIPLKRRKGNSLLQEYGFHGLLFFQRSLYWPKSSIGRCEREPGEKRCERADRLAQRFRLLNEVNNLRIIPQKDDMRPLTADERQILLAKLSVKKEATFDEMKKWLGLLEGDGFNLEAGNRKKLLGAPIDFVLSKKDLFGKNWGKFSEELKNAIVRSLIDDEDEEIMRKAMTVWGCSPELAAALAEVDLSGIAGGYASYSRVAIAKLLPHMEAGLLVMTRDGTPSALQAAGYLRPDQKEVEPASFLPPPPESLVNPLVKQGLHEVRKVVNAILRTWGRPNAIHIELARDVQGSVEQRRKTTFDMREREQRRNVAADFIRERGHKTTRNAIERCLLWREQGEICLYSGKPISPQQLFSSEVDVDHILPYSKSLDDSLMNKALVFRAENDRKGQQTVWGWVGETDPQKFEQILQRARNLPYEIRNRKILKLKQKEVELTDFLNRQLNDTAYLASQVREYLLPLVKNPLADILCNKGQLTATLRQMWGLNTVLRDDNLNLKNREDHRHHAVDALVIALTNRSRLQKLAAVRFSDQELPLPWKNFREQVQERVDGIKVSHRAVRDLSGALHEETIYGPTSKPQYASAEERPHAQGWVEEEGIFVVRKKLEDLTPAMVDDIRDPQVKGLVIARLRAKGIEPGSKGKISKEVWAEPLYMDRKQGRKASQAAIIKKVRLLRRDATIQPIRRGTACVKPGNTHHIVLFELPGSTPEKPKRDLVAVSMMDASARARRGEPLISRVHPEIPEARFLFSLSGGELVLAKFKGQPEDIYVFRTASSTTKQMKFFHHLDARMSAEAKLFTAYPNTLSAVKITVVPLGRIRNAND